MILWVCEAVKDSGLFDLIIVATDSQEVNELVRSHGFKAMMTDEKHSCGTERCEQVLNRLELLEENYDIVVNIQGDEPLIRKEQLEAVLKDFMPPTNKKEKALWEANPTQIATLMRRITEVEELQSANAVKVVASQGCAIYFSRSIIPFYRDKSIEEGLKEGLYCKHIGLYAYQADVLHKIVRLAKTPLEQAESLEQLRWLENGFKIKIRRTPHDSFGVDTPEDLALLEKRLRSKE
jgi:3-deoxy-manno-octulosonate cytidylyltransferase (CMP-KDO synthetase)